MILEDSIYSSFCIFVICLIAIFIPEKSRAEFIKLREDKVTTCSFNLAEAKNIPHQCLVITDESSPLEFWQNRLAFDFGKISQQDFIFLNNTYGSWSESKTTVSYNRDKSYRLLDFLPPLIQALNDHRFAPESRPFKKRNGNFLEDLDPSQVEAKKYLYMNCWGLVYEVLRAATNKQAEPMVFMGQGSLMLEQLRQKSEILLTLKDSAKFPIAEGLTQPGDLILVKHKSSEGYEYLDHIAIIIADGLYFEKAGAGEHVPMRIIDEQTLTKIWPPGVFYYELRRLHQNTSFPHPQEIFSINSSQIRNRFFPLATIPKELKNTSITWDIETNDFSSILWFYMINIAPLLSDESKKAILTENLYQPLLIKP